MSAETNLREGSRMSGSEVVGEMPFPVFFYAGNGAPAGSSIAILEGTELPVDLDTITGLVDSNGDWECDNLTSGPGAWDWSHSDWNGNIIYKLRIENDEAQWTRQNEEYQAA